MSTGGIVLILAVLILGGVIATLGDRIGTKVGKARLSLFNLRPKKTAVLVTVITGVMIAASTLVVLLLASQGFREMVLRFDSIRSSLTDTQKDLDKAKAEIKSSVDEKKVAETELTQARNKTRQVQRARDTVNEALKETESRRQLIEQQARSLAAKIGSLQQEQSVLASQRDQVLAQIDQRDRELQARDRDISEQEKTISSRDRQIISQERDLKVRDMAIADRGRQLEVLDQERVSLIQKSVALGQDIEGLRRESDRLRIDSASARLNLPSIVRNKVLASGVVRITNPKESVVAVSQLLQLANRVALRELQPNIQTPERILDVRSKETEQELNSLIERISDGKDYLVQIRAGENYFFGETTEVKIRTLVVINRTLFQPGDMLASIYVDPSRVSAAALKDQFNELLPRARLKAVSSNWFPDPANDGIDFNDIRSTLKFFDQVRELNEPVEIRAIAAENVTPGTPIIHLELAAFKNGEILLQTKRSSN